MNVPSKRQLNAKRRERESRGDHNSHEERKNVSQRSPLENIFLERSMKVLRNSMGGNIQYSMQAASFKGWNGNIYQPEGMSIGAMAFEKRQDIFKWDCGFT